MRKKIIIFGSSGKLGKAITSKAHKFGFDVIGIGRNKDENCKKYHQVDYLDFLNLKKEVYSSFDYDPSAFIFAHRSRLKINPSNLDFYNSLKTELNPYLALHETIEKIKLRYCINTVTVSSNAALKLNYDINNYYHIIKSTTLSAGLSLALSSNHKKVFSNAVIFGEVSNNSLNNNSNEKERIFNSMKKINSNTLTDIADVSNLILTLCSANELKLSGQVISSDGGFNNISNESLIRMKDFI